MDGISWHEISVCYIYSVVNGYHHKFISTYILPAQCQVDLARVDLVAIDLVRIDLVKGSHTAMCDKDCLTHCTLLS